MASTTPPPVSTPPASPPAIVQDVSFIANPNATRLKRLGRQLLRRLTGGHPTADSPYGERECMLALEEFRVKRQGEIEMYNADRQVKFQQEDIEFRRKQFFEDYEFIYKLGGSNEQWIRHYDLQVFSDEDRGLKYCLLPEQFIAIKRYQNLPPEQGIQRIERVKWAANLNHAPRYIPVVGGTSTLMAGVYRAGGQGNIWVERDEDRAYLKPDPNCTEIKDASLRFYFVLRPDRSGLPEPGLMQDVSDMDMVLGAEVILLRKVAEDKIPDNNATAA